MRERGGIRRDLMSKEEGLSEEAVNQLYRKLMPKTPDPKVEKAAAYVYTMIKGYDNFLHLEEGINAYSAAAEWRGFKEGLLIGIRMALDEDLINELIGLKTIH